MHMDHVIFHLPNYLASCRRCLTQVRHIARVSRPSHVPHGIAMRTAFHVALDPIGDLLKGPALIPEMIGERKQKGLQKGWHSAGNEQIRHWVLNVRAGSLLLETDAPSKLVSLDLSRR